MIKDESDLEKKCEGKKKVKDSSENCIEGSIKAIPAIIGCSVLSSLLGLNSCVAENIVSKSDWMFHLAAGSGLYSGGVNKWYKHAVSLVALGASFTPEIIQVVQSGDIKHISTSAGVKCAGYGVGYLISYFFTNKN